MTPERAERELSARKAGTPYRTILAGVFSLIVAIGIGRFSYTPTLPVMREALDLTTGAAGALASSNNLGYLAGAVLAALVPAGPARRRILRVSLVVVATTTAAVALTTSFPIWLFLRFVTGLAAAGVFVLASSAVIEELLRRGKGELTGWFYSGVGLGIALSGLAVMPANALLAAGLAWRADWLLIGVCASLLVVPCWTWLPRDRPVEDSGGCSGRQPGRDSEASAHDTPRSQSAGVPVGIPLVISLLCAAYFLEGGGYIVTGTFLPVIVDGLPGLEGAGVMLWVLVGLAAAPSTLVWARIASITGRPAALIVAYAAQATGIVLPTLFSASFWMVAASTVLYGGTIIGIVSLTLTYARAVIGAEKAGLAIGSLTAIYGVGQVIGPLAGAALADGPDGFGPALITAATAVALGGVLMIAVALYDRRSRIASGSAEAGGE